MVFQNLRTYQRAEIDTVHIGTLDDTLTIVIIQGSHIGSLLAATIDGKVVVMADTCTKYLLLPIGRSSIVISIIQFVCLYIAPNIIGRSHIQSLGNMVETYITRVGYVHTLLIVLAFLGGNHNHTIGSLGTIDSCSRGITEDINALDIVRSHH